MEDKAKPRDLEERTFRFAEAIRAFVKQLPSTISNTEDVRQLVRASGSVSANWIEADEALSKKDFLMRVKICRKRSKREPVVLAFDRCEFVAKHRICSRQISGGGSRIDIDFLCDHLEDRVIPFLIWDLKLGICNFAKRLDLGFYARRWRFRASS
jgi:23S rRNA-intervening sequence protein